MKVKTLKILLFYNKIQTYKYKTINNFYIILLTIRKIAEIN